VLHAAQAEVLPTLPVRTSVCRARLMTGTQATGSDRALASVGRVLWECGAQTGCDAEG
jgi:hypothetical protein